MNLLKLFYDFRIDFSNDLKIFLYKDKRGVHPKCNSSQYIINISALDPHCYSSPAVSRKYRGSKYGKQRSLHKSISNQAYIRNKSGI